LVLVKRFGFFSPFLWQRIFGSRKQIAELKQAIRPIYHTIPSSKPEESILNN